MVKQIIMYVAVIALLMFVLILVGTGLFFTLTGAGAPRSELSFVTTTPNPNETMTEPTTEMVVTAEDNAHSSEAPVLATASTKETLPPNLVEAQNMHATPEATVQETLTSESMSSESENGQSETPSPTAPRCGISQAVTILMINTGGENDVNSSQAINLVHIDPLKQEITLVSPPCNLWVSTPSLVKDYTISALPLCSIIPIINRSVAQEKRPEALAAAYSAVLSDNLGIKIDHSTVTSTASIKTIVAKLGKIEINSDETISLFGINLQNGSNELDASSAALLFAASPLDASSWVTVKRQNEIIKGIYAQLGDPSVSIPEILMASDVQTDLSEQDAADLSCTLKEIQPEHIDFSDVIEQNSSTDADGILRINDKEVLKSAITALFK